MEKMKSIITALKNFRQRNEIELFYLNILGTFLNSFLIFLFSFNAISERKDHKKSLDKVESDVSQQAIDQAELKKTQDSIYYRALELRKLIQ